MCMKLTVMYRCSKIYPMGCKRNAIVAFVALSTQKERRILVYASNPRPFCFPFNEKQFNQWRATLITEKFIQIVISRKYDIYIWFVHRYKFIQGENLILCWTSEIHQDIVCAMCFSIFTICIDIDGLSLKCGLCALSNTVYTMLESSFHEPAKLSTYCVRRHKLENNPRK